VTPNPETRRIQRRRYFPAAFLLRCEAPNYQTFIFDHEFSIHFYLPKEATFAAVESLTARETKRAGEGFALC